MKRLLGNTLMSLTAVFSLLVLNPGLVAAHVLKQDNGVSGVLHIPPEDNPSAGKPTQLAVSFGSDANNFSLAHCDCQVTVKRDQQTVQTVPLKPALSGATLEAAASVTFPSVAVYDVIVSGASQDGSFHDFSLDYSVRVATGTADSQATTSAMGGTNVVIVSLASIAVVGLVAYAAIRSGGRYTSNTSVKQPKSKEKK